VGKPQDIPHPVGYMKDYQHPWVIWRIINTRGYPEVYTSPRGYPEVYTSPRGYNGIINTRGYNGDYQHPWVSQVCYTHPWVSQVCYTHPWVIRGLSTPVGYSGGINTRGLFRPAGYVPLSVLLYGPAPMVLINVNIPDSRHVRKCSQLLFPECEKQGAGRREGTSSTPGNNLLPYRKQLRMFNNPATESTSAQGGPLYWRALFFLSQTVNSGNRRERG